MGGTGKLGTRAGGGWGGDWMHAAFYTFRGMRHPTSWRPHASWSASYLQAPRPELNRIWVPARAYSANAGLDRASALRSMRDGRSALDVQISLAIYMLRLSQSHHRSGTQTYQQQCPPNAPVRATYLAPCPRGPSTSRPASPAARFPIPVPILPSSFPSSYSFRASRSIDLLPRRQSAKSIVRRRIPRADTKTRERAADASRATRATRIREGTNVISPASALVCACCFLCGTRCSFHFALSRTPFAAPARDDHVRVRV